ncbi:hypothetical protein BU14_0115s0011 [Porphyra umbilicalis]|uniref:Uncharacterized protein n=1 Tax=Porphyra umbilicalis TaxID=2786 RepID=A0A1X6PBX2_PORUM|nr:hypothetical protein BU14_0115s0011 [Porphyra umbilicalis]|eukprot:OSX78240.1 hypothetical protein BU14_0115s0011 [Porphyra umbilicalis]
MPTWYATRAAERDLISTAQVCRGGLPPPHLRRHLRTPLPIPAKPASPYHIPEAPITIPPGERDALTRLCPSSPTIAVGMASGRTTANTSAPSPDERTYKEALRAFASSRSGVPSVAVPSRTAVPIAPSPFHFGSSHQHPIGAYNGQMLGQLYYKAVSAHAASLRAAAAVEAAGAVTAGTETSSVVPAPLQRDPMLDVEEATIAPPTSTTRLTEGLASSKGKQPKTLATAGRPTPTRRSSLPAVPSLASLPGFGGWDSGAMPSPSAWAALGNASAAVDSLSSRRAGFKPRATRDAAGKTAAAKAVAVEAASAKVAAEYAAYVAAHKATAVEEPYAEALAGLLQLPGQAACLGKDAKSTRGASLSSLSKAIGNMEVADASTTATRPSVRSVVDCMSEEGCEPAAKRPKISSVVKPRFPLGGASAAAKPDTHDDQRRPTATLSLRVPPLTPSQKLASATAAELTKKRAKGLTMMLGARRLLKARVKTLTGMAKMSADVFLSPRQRAEEAISAVREYAKYTDSQATEFLLEKVLKPTRPAAGDKRRQRNGSDDNEEGDSTSTKKEMIGVNHKLKEGVSHVYKDLKRNIVTAWFYSAHAHPKTSMTPACASKWLTDDRFYKLPGGRKAVLKAVVKEFKYLGAHDRVHRAVNPGSEDVVDLTCGHFVLVVKIIREELVSIMDGTPVKQGPDLNGYKDNVCEFLRLNERLRKHSLSENGMTLCDGGCEVGVVKWVRCFTMAEVLGRVQPPNVPQAAPGQVNTQN